MYTTLQLQDLTITRLLIEENYSAVSPYESIMLHNKSNDDAMQVRGIEMPITFTRKELICSHHKHFS